MATPRTINGTSFNGNTNITTANWGTARTFTIGNTGKSVNGSGNISWSLSEIGAAASNHNHDSVYIKSSQIQDGSSANTILWSSNYIENTFSKYNHNHDSVYMKSSEMPVTTIKKTLKITTSWMDTGITGTNLASGSYIVQVSGIETGPSNMYSEVFTGFMTWHSNTTNNNDADEIILHKAGHSSNGGAIYLRTIRTLDNNLLKLQICSAKAFTGNSGITFKFRKML